MPLTLPCLSRLIVCALAILSLPTALAGNADPDKTTAEVQPRRVVMVRVGEREITVADFMAYLSRNATLLELTKTPEGKGKVLRGMVEEELLDQALQREGLITAEAPYKERRLARLKLAAAKYNPPKPDPQAVRDYYEQHKAEFDLPRNARLSQIYFFIPEDATPEAKAAVRARAEATLQRLKDGEDFAKVANEVTENPLGKGRGGDVGPVWVDEWLEGVLRELTVGQYTGVMQSPYDAGLQIIRLTELHEAKPTPFEEARAGIANSMRSDAEAKLREAYIRSLLTQIPVELVLEDLKQAYPKGLFE